MIVRAVSGPRAAAIVDFDIPEVTSYIFTIVPATIVSYKMFATAVRA